MKEHHEVTEQTGVRKNAEPNGRQQLYYRWLVDLRQFCVFVAGLDWQWLKGKPAACAEKLYQLYRTI